MSQQDGFSGNQTLRSVVAQAVFIRECPREQNLWEKEEGSHVGQREMERHTDLMVTAEVDSRVKKVHQSCPLLGQNG